MANENLIKDIHQATAELRTEVKSLEAKYDGLLVDKIAKIEEATAELQKQAADFRNASARNGESKEMEVRKEVTDKLLRKGFEFLTDAERKALSITGTSNGGSTVPEVMDTAIVDAVQDEVVIRKLARVSTTSSDNMKFSIQSGFGAAGLVAETDTRTVTTSPTIEPLEIKVFEIYANPEATLAVLEDSAYDLEGWLNNELANGFIQVEADNFMSGAGTAGPKGILTSASTSAAAWNNVNIQETDTVGAVGYDDVLDLFYALKRGYRRNASWVVSDPFQAAVRKLTNDTGDYLWQDQLSLDAPPTILGKPVYTDENLESVAIGNDVAIFGDFAKGYQIVDRPGLTITRDVYSKKGFIQFYTRKRVGGNILDGRALRVLRVKAA